MSLRDRERVRERQKAEERERSAILSFLLTITSKLHSAAPLVATTNSGIQLPSSAFFPPSCRPTVCIPAPSPFQRFEPHSGWGWPPWCKHTMGLLWTLPSHRPHPSALILSLGCKVLSCRPDCSCWWQQRLREPPADGDADGASRLPFYCCCTLGLVPSWLLIITVLLLLFWPLLLPSEYCYMALLPLACFGRVWPVLQVLWSLNLSFWLLWHSCIQTTYSMYVLLCITICSVRAWMISRKSGLNAWNSSPIGSFIIATWVWNILSVVSIENTSTDTLFSRLISH